MRMRSTQMNGGSGPDKFPHSGVTIFRVELKLSHFIDVSVQVPEYERIRTSFTSHSV
jgi:hypothetical protein